MSNEEQVVSVPRRVGRPPGLRPKYLPLKTRTRLANLGIGVPSRDATDKNLKILISALSSDLERYRLIAEHWQQKLIRTQQEEKRDEEADPGVLELESSGIRDPNLVLPNTGVINLAQLDILNRLVHAADSSLKTTVLPLPTMRGSVSGLISEILTERFFSGILEGSCHVADIFGVYKGSSGMLAPLTRLKPNFDETRARQVWQNLFETIETSHDAIQWASGPNSRTSYVEDPDIDAMDRLFQNSSDYDILDMLHYCSIFLMGINHILFDNPRFEKVREHLGTQMERLLKEAIFTRSLGSHADYAQQFASTLLDTLFHFTALGRFGALKTLQEIAWQICESHPDNVHPITKGLILFQTTCWAENTAKRRMWLEKTMENVKSAEVPYYHMTTCAYISGCFVSLAHRDLEGLLHYLTLLEGTVINGPEPELGSVVGTPYSHSSSSTHHQPTGMRSIIADDGSLGSQFWIDQGTELDEIFNYSESSTARDSYLASPSHSSSSDDTSYQSLDVRVVMDEQSNSCTRIGMKLLRSEASALAGDSESCRHWVDEAEKEILKMPDYLILQNVFMTDTPATSNAFQSVCQFESGTHSISREIEMRIARNWVPKPM